jgi:hypothetical protein
MKVVLSIALLIFVLFSCGNANKINDGKQCADVKLYNPSTGKRSTYILNVEVENNKLIIIYWANGGWLDDSHFNPPKLDGNNWCTFISDKGQEYEIQITSEPCIFE